MSVTFYARIAAFAAAQLLIATFAASQTPLDAPVDSESLNVPAEVRWHPESASLTISYRGSVLFNGAPMIADGTEPRPARVGEVDVTVSTSEGRELEQRITLTSKTGVELHLIGGVLASGEAIAAETRTAAQERFPLIRAVSGRSSNLRNNAVYDRRWDWVLSGPGDGATNIAPTGPDGSERSFFWGSSGGEIELLFRPLYYQRHKNLPHYEPWTYRVWEGSIAGWCSWWAYRTSFDQTTLEKVVEVLAAQNLADYGYRYIQIDDTFQTSMGLAEGWLSWDEQKFPGGAAGAVRTITAGRFEPGIWVYSAFHDEELVKEHPDWFVRNEDGELFKGPWVGYGLDGNNEEALAAVVRATERGFRDLGFRYVKIDSLRHLLYDSYHHAIDHLAAQGADPADTFRRYLGAAREELGRDIFMLACWGVLPESIGIADACRLGGDGFGPATLQQYNSWNGIVWRNDPDHCDILPHWKPAEAGNVTKVEEVEASATDAIQRPCLVSMASGMLMLSDRWEVYANPKNLEGVKRTAPIVFTVPGQLYDFNPTKTDTIVATKRTDILGGGPPSPIDADQTGVVCNWWMMEVERPFESWTVLAHFNWGGEELPAETVRMSDLGLHEGRDYLVYEFWEKRFLGSFTDNFEVPALPPGGTQILVLRERLDRPQLLSTSRHITQGAVDVLDLEWDAENRVLFGSSAVVRGDPYELTMHVPPGFWLRMAGLGVGPPAISGDNTLVRVSCVPEATGPMSWFVQFEQQR